MQIRIKVTPADIRKALERHKTGFVMDSPLSVAMERQGYKGAVHSPNKAYAGMWAYNAPGTAIMRVALSRRAMIALGAWWANQKASESTYILDAEQTFTEPHFPGYEG